MLNRSRSHFLAILIALLLLGCDQQETPEEAFSRGRTEGYQEGQRKLANDSEEFRNFIDARVEEAVKDARAKGFDEGKAAALPGGWSPSDGVTTFLFGGSAIVGVIIMVGKILSLATALIASARTEYGKALNFFSLILSGIICYWLFRMFGIETAVSEFLLKPNAGSTSEVVIYTGTTAILIFVFLLVIRKFFSNIDTVFPLMVLSLAHGAYSTLVVTSLFAVFSVDTPSGFVSLLIGMGIFAGTSFFGLTELYKLATKEERELAKAKAKR